MGEAIGLPIYLLFLYAGYLLPIPSGILAWREWIKTAKESQARPWRRRVSQIGLLLLTVGLAFGVTVAVAENTEILSQQTYYGSWAMRIGVSGSIATIGISLLAERKLRRYLLVGALGLVCLFGVGLIETI